ncbi:MAG: RagB/SusD family nutrient uptake outer membrane protein [Cytophagales bacterium]|nr:RagB/SusD family nutrient uptake outer membrane protein [Cytophagales bacterium]
MNLIKNIKNRTKRGIALSLVLCLAIVYSCDDSFLDVPATGALDLNLLATGPGMESALIAAYAQVNGRANRMASPSNWVWGSIRGGDANKGTDPGDFSDINPIQRYEAIPSQGVINDLYTGAYEGVARANAVLKLANAAPAETSAQQAQILQIRAQSRFLRGHFYFQLKRAFGNTPYADETIDVEGAGLAPGIELIKNDQDLWPKIEADFQFAYDNLPVTQSQVGRVNKWAAGAYLAKVYMYQGKFAQAKALFDLMINLDGTGKVVTSNNKTWGLVPSYADVFKASNDNNEESIWAYQAAANTGSVNNANPEFDLNFPYNTGPNGPGNCCGFFQPSFELASSFRTDGSGLPLLNGSYKTAGQELLSDMGVEGTSAWDDEAEYKKDGFVTRIDPAKPKQERVYKALSDNSGEDPLTEPTIWQLVWVESTNSSFADLSFDPRLDHSIGRRGIPYLDWIDFPGKPWIRNQPNGGPYAPKKYIYYKSDQGSLQDNSSWTPGYTAINYTIIRYADVLLMAAEAEIEAGDPAIAKVYVNAVRARAANSILREGGVPVANYIINQYPAGDTWAKDDATREKVRFERKLELSGEGHRFFDLVRWGVAAPTLTAYLAYESVKLPNALSGSVFNANKDELLPIPQAQIDLVGPNILQQNPGF